MQLEVRRDTDNSVVFTDANVNPFPIGSYLISESATFLSQAGEYLIILSQVQGVCTLTSTATIVIQDGLSAEVADVLTSFHDETAGALTIRNIQGGLAPYYSSLELLVPITAGQEYNSTLSLVTNQDANFRFFRRYEQLPAGTYEIILEDENGCRLVLNDVIVPKNENIFIPNIFTPDNDPDKKNEVFLIRNLAPNSKLVVTNRWGNEVFSSNNYNNSWNGNGVADGVYFYRLSSGGKEYSGWVEILRGNKP
jgi:hypothetical protein